MGFGNREHDGGSMSDSVRSTAVQSTAEGLVELGKAVSAPAYTQSSEYAALMGKTLIEMNKPFPSHTESLIERLAEKRKEDDISALEAAFSGKGIVVRGKG